MTEAVLGLRYDPKVLTVSPADITLGSIPAAGNGWRLESVIDPASGQLVIDLYSTTAITQTQGGSLANIAFHVMPDDSVSGPAVRLASSVTPLGHWYATEVADDETKFVLGLGA